MKKIIVVFLLTSFSISCTNDNDPEKEEKNPYIDERILGTWLVDYSVEYDPASYDLESGEIIYDEEKVKIREYFGEYKENPKYENRPRVGLFNTDEYKIEIREDNTFTIYRINTSGFQETKDVYMVRDGLFLRLANKDINDPIVLSIMDYKLKDGKLIMTYFDSETHPVNLCAISIYSRE